MAMISTKRIGRILKTTGVSIALLASGALPALADVSIGTNISTSAGGTISSAGLLTGTLGLTVTGAAVNLNASSNFATNIGTGTTTSAVAIGGNGNTVAIDSSSWDVSTAGVASGLTGLTSTGNVTVSGAQVLGASPLVFEGLTDNDITTIFAITNPTTTNKTITFPDASITVNAAADLSGATLATGVTASSLTSVGTLTALTVAGDLTVSGGDVTGTGGELIDISEATANAFTFTRNDVGAVTLTSADDNADADLIVGAGGTGALTLGDSGSTTSVTSSDWAIGATGIMTGIGAITVDAGTACTAPSVNFAGGLTTGFYRIDIGATASPGIGLCIAGTKAGFISIGSTPATFSYGNTVIGWGSGLALDLSGGGAGDDALHNTIFGAESGTKITTSMQNTYIGNRVGHENVLGGQNTCVGQGACYENEGSRMVAVGFHAGLEFGFDVAQTGSQNTFIGTQSGEGQVGLSTGDGNTCVGETTCQTQTTAIGNTALGHQALKVATTGNKNVALGWRAGDSLTTSTDNVFIGREAGQAISTQTPNTFIGAASGANATGTNNTTVGYLSGGAITTGYSNTFMGHLAGVAATTGFENVMIGDKADAAAINTSNAIVIGMNITAPTNHVQIGNASNTEFKLGTIKTSGTVASARVPGALAAASITLPTCSSTVNTFALIAVDDTNDGAKAMLCWCRAGADDATYAWTDTADNTTACVDP